MEINIYEPSYVIMLKLHLCIQAHAQDGWLLFNSVVYEKLDDIITLHHIIPIPHASVLTVRAIVDMYINMSIAFIAYNIYYCFGFCASP